MTCLVCLSRSSVRFARCDDEPGRVADGLGRGGVAALVSRGVARQVCDGARVIVPPRSPRVLKNPIGSSRTTHAFCCPTTRSPRVPLFPSPSSDAPPRPNPLGRFSRTLRTRTWTSGTPRRGRCSRPRTCPRRCAAAARRLIAGPPPAASTSREGAWRARAEDATATPPTPPSTATRTTPRTTLTSWTISRSTARRSARTRSDPGAPTRRSARPRPGPGRVVAPDETYAPHSPRPTLATIEFFLSHDIASPRAQSPSPKMLARDAATPSAPPATPRRRLPPPRASRPDPATATNDATPRLPRDVPTTRRRRPRGYGRAVSNGTRMSWRSWRWTMTTVEARERIPVEARIERARARTRFRRVRRRCLRPSRRVWTRRRPRVDVIDRACPASTVRSRRGSGRISLHLREERRESETRRRRLQKVSRPTPPPSRRVEESLERDETRPGKRSSGDDDRRRERERAPRRTARERVRRRVRDCFRDRVRVIEGFVSRRRSRIIRR